MKKLLYTLILIAITVSSCNDYETYGDQKEKERNAISKFIADSSFTIISEDQFAKNGYKTDLQRKEFVKLDKSGVYMQIVREGCGKAIQDGESTIIDCRYTEFNILNDTIETYNNVASLSYLPDRMSVSRTGGTYTASFISGIMYSYYSATVPPGWLVALNYIKVGRPQSMDEACSKVRLIVPHTQGHATAASKVTPYFYTITFQRES